MYQNTFTHLFSQRVWLLLAAALLVGLAVAVVPRPVAAHGGDANGDGLFTSADCASHLGQSSAPWNGTGQVTTSGFGTIPFHTGSGWWAYAAAGAIGEECEDFAYFLVNTSPAAQKNYLIYPTWDTTLPAEWCGHSVIDYAVFVKPQGQSKWTYQGGGFLFGKASTNPPQYYDSQCKYLKDEIIDRGTNVVKFPFHQGQIAVIVKFWAHNHTDVATTDCRYEYCFHPGRVYVRHG